MKKVDPILIPELNRLAENQRVKTNITPAGDLVMSDFSYKKGHDIPEGYYLVKLAGIKCHGPTCYYMDLEVLQDAFSLEEFPEPKAIKGYGWLGMENCGIDAMIRIYCITLKRFSIS